MSNPQRSPSLMVTGTTAFAGMMLATLGVFQILEGISAIANDHIYVSGVKYVFDVDITAWGWFHLILGIIGLATGIGILMGQTWGYIVGLVIAFISAASSFAFLPYYPGWAFVIIAFDVLVIWALTRQVVDAD
ncbi:DUF7144 family membrane protein [Marmoricola sp. RAF53]|uniref:DUF7144 family membrane protein n=1 Tax=Marmoricola sp. RAF53 TaxID=3233059 RepID=UPI003F999F02